MSRAMALGWPVLACALMAAAARLQAGTAETLDNEAVVGMVASGMAEIAIVRAIQDAPRVSFDLDAEVVRELAAAGVTPKIIQAMRDRQGPAPVLEKPLPPPAPQGKLLVRLRSAGGKKGEPVVYEVIRKIPKWAANEMGMLQRPEVEELAFFLLCTRPDHVPDHWEDRSELKGFTRHEKLLFRTGSRPGKSRGFEVLALDLPESLELSTDAGNHRLVAGVAAKAGPDWHVVGSAELKSVEVHPGETTTLEVTLGGKVTGSRMSAFKEQQSVSMVEIPRGSATP